MISRRFGAKCLDVSQATEIRVDQVQRRETNDFSETNTTIRKSLANLEVRAQNSGQRRMMTIMKQYKTLSKEQKQQLISFLDIKPVVKTITKEKIIYKGKKQKGKLNTYDDY